MDKYDNVCTNDIQNLYNVNNEITNINYNVSVIKNLRRSADVCSYVAST